MNYFRARWIVAAGICLSNLTVGVGSAHRFSESFDGNGEFETVNGRNLALDNQGWVVTGDAVIEDGGLWMPNEFPFPVFGEDSDRVGRVSEYTDGFVERIEIKDPFFGVYEEGSEASGTRGQAIISHSFDSRQGMFLSIGEYYEEDILGEGKNDPTDWQLTFGFPGKSSEIPCCFPVPIGNQIALEIIYTKNQSEIMFRYDNEIADDVLPISFGPYEMFADLMGSHSMNFTMVAGTLGVANGLLDNWTFSPENLEGDFNGNDRYDVDDIDLLINAMRSGLNDPEFDVVSDGRVDEFDLSFWVKDLANTWFGDSNLDREFNSSDLVSVFMAAEYEDDIGQNSTWQTGDWNGDGEFNSRDLILAFSDGGYESGRGIHHVPEPSPIVLLAGLLFIINMRFFRIHPA